MMFRANDIAKLAGTVIAVAALGLAVPGGAAADTKDEAFLRRVSAEGLMFGGSDQVIARAQKVCAGFGSGMSTARVHAMILGNSAFTPGQTAIFMADAVQVYCPRYANVLFG